MSLPIELAPGILFDLRHAFLVLVASYGGWVATIITAIAALSFRIWQGGAGAVPGVVGILVSASIGLCFAYFYARRPAHRLEIAALGIVSNVALFSLFLLPWSTAITILGKIGGPIALANVVGVLVAAEILNRNTSQYARERDLAAQARIDALTGLANRRVFDEHGSALAEAAIRLGQSCAIMVVDIDHFKRVNDTFGHLGGDDVIRRVAAVVAENARPGDLVARYGGEEIALVFPGQDAANTQLVADRIRNAVEAMTIDMRGIAIKVTISVGFSVVGNTEGAFLMALQAADNALYDAKAAGRNRVIAALAA